MELELRFQCARDGVAAPSEIVTPSVATLPAVAVPRVGVTLTDAWNRYLNDPASSRSEKSALAYATVRSLVEALIGADTLLEGVGRQDCRKVLEVLQSLPTNYQKRWSDIAPRAAAARAKREGIPPMSISNANGYRMRGLDIKGRSFLRVFAKTATGFGSRGLKRIGTALGGGGAAYVTRTRDPIITNDVLYQLS